MGYSPWNCRESDMTHHAHMHIYMPCMKHIYEIYEAYIQCIWYIMSLFIYISSASA